MCQKSLNFIAASKTKRWPTLHIASSRRMKNFREIFRALTALHLTEWCDGRKLLMILNGRLCPYSSHERHSVTENLRQISPRTSSNDNYSIARFLCDRLLNLLFYQRPIEVIVATGCITSVVKQLFTEADWMELQCDRQTL